MTIEQLLTHASGLPREAGDHGMTNQFPSEEEIKRLMADRQAAFPPSTRWKYSNLAYTVAGLVVEAVSGEKWSDYVTRHIFVPLGMSASSVDRNDPGLTVGYGRRMPDGTRALVPFIDARGMASATGISSNVEDMAKFVSAQFRTGRMGGTQVLSTSSLRLMHRVRSVEETWTSGTGIGYGISTSSCSSSPTHRTTCGWNRDATVTARVMVSTRAPAMVTDSRVNETCGDHINPDHGRLTD